jgi:hypothetical protein
MYIITFFFKQKYEVDYAIKQLQKQFPNEIKKNIQLLYLMLQRKSVIVKEGKK